MSEDQKRFVALDIFRGLTICFMIIVNTPGYEPTTFAPLLHAKWFGFTPTDLVFPSFLFVTGNAMFFASKKWPQMPASRVWGKILKRSFIIFLLGFLLYWFPFFQRDAMGQWIAKPLSHLRIMGVLQRIAVAYLISALLVYYCKTRTLIIISALLLILYYPIMLYGGYSGKDPFSMYGNVVLRFDTFFLGANHLYHDHGELYPFDPEGFFSTIPAIVNVVAGYLAGKFIIEKKMTLDALLRIALIGFVLICIAYLWNYRFPVSKKIWTSSFVLLTVGIDCLIMVLVIYWTDILHKPLANHFFIVFGKNPLIIYLLSELLATVLYTIDMGNGINFYTWLFQHFFIFFSPYIGSLLQALCFMLLCWSVGYWMDRKKIYIRV